MLRASGAILGALEALEKNGSTKVKADVLQNAYRLAILDEELYRSAAQAEEKVRDPNQSALPIVAEIEGNFPGNFIHHSRLRQQGEESSMDASREVSGLLSDLMRELGIRTPNLGRV